MGNNKYQKIIAHVLGTRPIAFNPDLAKALGSAKAGLFLSQLLFWWGKGDDPNWIYKTIGEMEKETTLSRAEQDSAIKICKNFDLLKITIKGIPAKRHFWLDVSKIVKLLESVVERNNKQDCEKVTNSIVGHLQTNTESDTKNTNKERDSSSKQDKANAYKQGERWGEKPYYRRSPMRWKPVSKRFYVIENGEWLEFAGKDSEIEWR